MCKATLFVLQLTCVSVRQPTVPSQDAPSENGHDVGQAVFEQANDARQEQPAVPALEPEDDDDRWSTLAYPGVLNQFDPPKSEIQWMLVD